MLWEIELEISFGRARVADQIKKQDEMQYCSNCRHAAHCKGNRQIIHLDLVSQSVCRWMNNVVRMFDEIRV